MISNISSTTPRIHPSRTQPAESAPPDQALPQDSLASGPSSEGPGFLRKSAGVVAAAAAGTGGLVYGGVLGAVDGVKQLPATTGAGFQLGTKVMEPVTRTLGAAVAVTMTGVTGAAVAAGAILAPVAGFAAGTVEGAVVKGGDLVKGGVRTAARAGVTIGSAVLGAAGGTLGALVGLCTLPTLLYPPLGMKVVPQAVRACATGGFQAGRQVGTYAGGAVGATLGALGGTTAALTVGLPEGWKAAQTLAGHSVEMVKTLPQTTRELWAAGQSAGVMVAQGTGGSVGAVGGSLVGLGGIGVEGTVQGIQKAAEWGVGAYQAVTGSGESE